MKRSRDNPHTQPANLTLFDNAPQKIAPTSDPVSSTPLPGIPGSDAEILTGTSAFTAAGWEGTFYPTGMKPADYLHHYSQRFRTVEVDSTFYGTPKPERVRNWYEKTPPDFIFAAKVPQVITHEKILVDCETEFAEFLQTMEWLGEKLGPLLFQFGYFAPGVLKNAAQFLARLSPFLKKLSTFSSRPHRYVVEIRNKSWLDETFLNTLRENNVALALTDHSWMPRPWELSAIPARSAGNNPTTKLDPITADFAYVRWLGDRKGIEAITTRWDKTVVDRRDDLLHWVELFRELRRRNLRVYAYANNHYAGNGPGTVKLFWELYESGR
ncbi:MAG TPA: DUF72 domain-containing protein [Candidatus Acidoferrum sp.]|nr:DUF72 domain-containing protein [Candidatus Acidoferrum sp.]